MDAVKGPILAAGERAEGPAQVARRRSLVALCLALLVVPSMVAALAEAGSAEGVGGQVLGLAGGLLGFVVLLVLLFRHFRTTAAFRTQGPGPFIGAAVVVPGFALLALALGALVAAFVVEPESYAVAGLAFGGAAGAAILAAHILSDRVLWGLGIGLTLVGILFPFLASASHPLPQEKLELLVAAMACVPALVLAVAEGVRGHVWLRFWTTRS